MNRIVSFMLCVVFLLAFLVSAYPMDAFATEDETTATEETTSDETSTTDEDLSSGQIINLSDGSIIDANSIVDDSTTAEDATSTEEGGIIDPDAVADEPTDYDSVKNPDNYISQVTGERVIDGVGQLSGLDYHPEGFRWDGNADPDVIDGEEFFTYEVINLEENPEMTEEFQVLINCDPMKVSNVPENTVIESEEELNALESETEEKITKVMEQTGYLDNDEEEFTNLWDTLKDAIFSTADAADVYTQTINGVQYICKDNYYEDPDNSGWETGEYQKYFKTKNNSYPAYCMYPGGNTTKSSKGNFTRAIILTDGNVRSYQSKVASDGYRELQYLARVCAYGYKKYGSDNNTLLHLRAAAAAFAYNIEYNDGGTWKHLINPHVFRTTSGESPQFTHERELWQTNGSLAQQIINYCKTQYASDHREFQMVLLIPGDSDYQPMVGIYCELEFRFRLQKTDGSGKGIPNVVFKLESRKPGSTFKAKNLVTAGTDGVTDFQIDREYWGELFRITEVSCPEPFIKDSPDKFIEFYANPKTNDTIKCPYQDAREDRSKGFKYIDSYVYAFYFHFRNNQGGKISVSKVGEGELDTSVGFSGYTSSSGGSSWTGHWKSYTGLAGAQFQVIAAATIKNAYGDTVHTSGTVVDTITTDNSGYGTSKYLPAGKYKIKEVSAPTGYKKSSIVKTVELLSPTDLGKGKIKPSWTEINPCKNERVKGYFKLIKEGPNQEKLAGAVFGIYDSKKNLLFKATTNSSGWFRIDYMPLGTYYYKELEAPEDYKITDTSYHSFKITSSDTTLNPKTVTMTNDKDTIEPNFGKLSLAKTGDVFGGIEVSKTDASVANGIWTQDELDNAKFTVTAKTDIVDATGATVAKKGDVVTTLTTSDGGATSKKLTPGEYTVTETSAPDGYINSGASKDVTVVADTVTPVWTSSNPLNNKKAKGNIKIVKVNKLTGDPLAKVKFAFRKKGEKTTYTLTTGTDGIVELLNVEPGDYEYWETYVPSPYVLDSTVHTITLKANETVTANPIEVTETVENIQGRIRVIKKDKDTDKPIEGVVFKFRKEGSDTVIATKTTNANGYADLTQISPGTYEFYETSVPDGYILDSTVHKATLTVTGKETKPIVITSTVYNKRKTVPLELKKVAPDLASLKVNNNGSVSFLKTSTLSGVTFTLKAAEDIYSGSTLMAKAGDTVAVLTTGEDGKVTTKKCYFRKSTVTDETALDLVKDTSKSDMYSDGLFQGEYSLYEEKSDANAAYNVSGDPIPITINFIVPSDEDNSVVEETTNEDGETVEEVVYKGTKTGETTLVQTTITNNTQTEDLKLRKIDPTTNKTLKGVQFKFFDADKNVIYTGTTNSNGEIKIEGLPLGTYYYQETKTIDGYLLDSTVREVTLKADSDNVVVAKNKPVRPVEFTKTDIITSKPLPGATIRIYLDDKTTVYDKRTTDETGRFTLRDVPAGTYYYQEIAAPDGFLIDSGLYEFVVDGNSKPTIQITLADKPVYGEVQIQKYGEDPTVSKMHISDDGKITYDKIKLAGARFALIADEDIKLYDASSQVFAKKGDTVAYFTTNDNGDGVIEGKGYYYRTLDSTLTDKTDLTTATSGTMTFEHALLGKYHLEEVTVPKSYRKCDNKSVTLTDKHDNKEIVYETVRFDNILETGGVEIRKIDAETIGLETKDQKPIEGAEITILNENQEVVVKALTNEKGQVKFTRLPVGKYYYFESQAPEGYELDKTVHEFEVKLDQIAQCNFTDETIYVLPGAGVSDHILPIIAVSFVAIVLVGTGIFVLTRKKS